MKKIQTIIHIGGNKTASTLLQRQLLSGQENIKYFGEDCINYDDLKDIINNMIHEDSFYYDANELISKFNLNNIEDNKTRIVFSNEDIMGSRHPSIGAKRLKKIFPNAQILMIIRNQLDVFPSWYINHGAYLKNVPKKFWRKYVNINNWLDYCFSFSKNSPVQAMNYYKYFQIYSEVFGEENIIVIPYEDIFLDKTGFCKKLSVIFDVLPTEIENVFSLKSERPRNSKLKYQIHKIFGFSHKISKTIYAFLSPIDYSGPAKVKLPRKWRNKINFQYANSNFALSKKIGINLKKYGYPFLENK
jgi:hypothetical protein